MPVAFVGVLAVGALVALGCASAPALSGSVRSVPLVVSHVSLPDVANGGTPLAMKAPPRGLLVVYFGYTSCPDICPTTMSEVGRALRDLPDDLRARITVAMATLDPERDTPERLAGYMDHFFGASHALRQTDEAALAQAAGAFEVTWQVEQHAPGEPYAIAHTALTYVIDDTGTVVDEWPFGFRSELMTSDLRTLLERYDR
jgi:protein SCO1/2